MTRREALVWTVALVLEAFCLGFLAGVSPGAAALAVASGVVGTLVGHAFTARATRKEV